MVVLVDSGANVRLSKVIVSTVNLHSDVKVYDITIDCFNCSY